jgi:hypothetical protein
MNLGQASNAERDREPDLTGIDNRRWVRVCRTLWPFWLFKDASRGDLYARAAARQHNRRMCARLPRYLVKWLAVCAIASAAIFTFDALATDVAHRLDVFVLMAAGSGIVCAYAICVVLVLAYAYCYLRLEEH